MSDRNCEYEYVKEFGWYRIKDIRVLKCEKCGKVKRENTRIRKPKERLK